MLGTFNTGAAAWKVPAACWRCSQGLSQRNKWCLPPNAHLEAGSLERRLHILLGMQVRPRGLQEAVEGVCSQTSECSWL